MYARDHAVNIPRILFEFSRHMLKRRMPEAPGVVFEFGVKFCGLATLHCARRSVVPSRIAINIAKQLLRHYACADLDSAREIMDYLEKIFDPSIDFVWCQTVVEAIRADRFLSGLSKKP